MTRLPGVNQEAHDPTGDEPAPTMPLMTGGMEQDSSLADDDLGIEPGSEGAAKLLGNAPVLMVAVLILAGVSLYLMRSTQSDLQADEQLQELETQFDTYLHKLANPALVNPDDPYSRENLKATLNTPAEVVEALSADRTSKQVPIGYVKKNPFALVVAPESSGVVNAGQDREHEKRMRELQAEVDRLKLQSITGGGRMTVAVINNEFYRVGDTVGSFAVIGIQDKQLAVTLGAEGRTYVLTMEE